MTEIIKYSGEVILKQILDTLESIHKRMPKFREWLCEWIEKEVGDCFEVYGEVCGENECPIGKIVMKLRKIEVLLESILSEK